MKKLFISGLLIVTSIGGVVNAIEFFFVTNNSPHNYYTEQTVSV